MDKNLRVFFELVSAGLREKDARLPDIEGVDFAKVYELAAAQSVVGLVVAGIEHLQGGSIPKVMRLQFASSTLQLEQRNQSMSRFTSEMVERMYEADLYPLLVKGQGLAQCYERPSWRSAGDVDFFFSKMEFQKAVDFFASLTDANVVQNARYTKSSGVVIGPWFVEVHGTLRAGLSTRLDKEIDRVQEDTFENKRVRIWQNGDVEIRLPGIDNDLFLVFVHFVRHFYKGGMSLRQLCDGCRLLWTYKGQVDTPLLARRLRTSGLMDEWLAFGAMAVEYLRMPAEAIPLYDDKKKWHDKASRIVDYVLKNGGVEKSIKKSFGLFPASTLRFLPGLLFNLNWLKVKERVMGKNS